MTLPATYYPLPPVVRDCDPSPGDPQGSSQIPAVTSTQPLVSFTVILNHLEQYEHLCQDLGIGTIIDDIKVSHYGCKMSLSLGPQKIDPAGLLLGRLGNFQNATHFTFIFTVTLHDAFRLWNSIFAIKSGEVGAEARGTTVAAGEICEEDALA
jgi:hypothetical protein